MATGISIAGVDLDAIFEPLGIYVAGPDTGITIAGVDLSQRYRQSGGYDEIAYNTGITIGGTDLRYFFREYGYTPPTPTITSFTYDGPKYEGEMITFNVGYTGYDVTGVELKAPGGSVLSSGFPPFLFTPTSYTQSGTYSVEVTNAGGTATEYLSVTVIEEVDPPVITAMSNTGPVAVGVSVTCTCTATDADTYQWRFAGVDISGATASTHTFTPIHIDESGPYTCTVTNAGGTDFDSTYVTVT